MLATIATRRIEPGAERLRRAVQAAWASQRNRGPPSSGRAADGDIFPGHRLRYAAAIDHGDAVGERQHLVEIIGDEEHAGAALARLKQMLMHIGDRTDIQAARRLAGEDEARFAAPSRGPGSASACCRRTAAASRPAGQGIARRTSR